MSTPRPGAVESLAPAPTMDNSIREGRFNWLAWPSHPMFYRAVPSHSASLPGNRAGYLQHTMRLAYAATEGINYVVYCNEASEPEQCSGNSTKANKNGSVESELFVFTRWRQILNSTTLHEDKKRCLFSTMANAMAIHISTSPSHLTEWMGSINAKSTWTMKNGAGYTHHELLREDMVNREGWHIH